MDKFDKFVKEYGYKGEIIPHIPTEFEILNYYDKLVADEEKHWGIDSFYAKSAKKCKEKALKCYLAGESIVFAKETFHRSCIYYGQDIEVEFYTDGSFSYSIYM